MFNVVRLLSIPSREEDYGLWSKLWGAEDFKVARFFFKALEP